MESPVEATKDPCGLDNVSGFYGPGAWTGWILAIVSSWYAIIPHSRSQSLYEVFFHVSYTNWAGVHIIRQIIAVLGDEHRLPELASLASVAGVAFWRSDIAFARSQCMSD